MIKHSKTTKLFYNLYALKVTLKLSTARALDGRNLSWMNGIFDKFSKIIGVRQNSWRSYGYTITQEEFDASKILFPVLIDNNDKENCQIRVEHHTIAVFTNDYSLLDYIVNNFVSYVKTVTKPESEEVRDLLLKYPRSILVDKPGSVKYCLSTKSLRRTNPGFGEWAKNLPGVNIVSRNGSSYQLDIVDDGVLMMVEMCVGDGLRKVQEYVTVDDLRNRK